MAAQQLDKLWGRWAIVLSKSHEKTLCLLEDEKLAEAHSEFREHFLVTVREIYSEAACASPGRFSKSKHWDAWLRHLYALSARTEKMVRVGALPSTRPKEGTDARDEAIFALKKLRAHFYKLRVESETRKSNDYLHAFHQETMKDKPNAIMLKVLRAGLDKAVSSLKAQDSPEAYRKAKDDWATRIAPILADDTVAPLEIAPLRSATHVFYRAYGMQIE